MKIEHIAIWAHDIEKLRSFYETYFGASSSTKYLNETKSFSSYFLRFATGGRLELMQKKDVKQSNRIPEKSYFGIAHIAFSVGSKELVDEMTFRLKKDSFKVLDGPRKTGDGYYESAVLDPEGNKLEITI